mgnify:CR=1 FL=1
MSPSSACTGRVEKDLHGAQDEEQYTGLIAGCQEGASMRDAIPDSGHIVGGER